MMDSIPEPSTSRPEIPRALPILDLSKSHNFIRPAKRIHEGHDVPHFLSSKAYTDIGVFITQLNNAMCPRQVSRSEVQTFPLNSPAVTISPPIQRLKEMLDVISAIVEEAPPDTGPRRFGNVAFRKWHALLEERTDGLLGEYSPVEILNADRKAAPQGNQPEREGDEADDEVTAKEELKAYLLGGFGSAQRLDYGTGHELSFLAFLGGIWKLGGFTPRDGEVQGAMERSIVLGIVEPYLRVIRKLILTYTLEPAGSHGVWGLDDHAFIPYIFGSAQYCPAIAEGEIMPIEGSLTDSPNPGDVAKKSVVDRERNTNMYFAAVGFINDVKTGPFWEHSPILFDISGIRNGWGKINKGMIKMYNAEVLSKFPVVQHFPFGSLFSWEHDPSAPPPPTSMHVANQPSSHTISVTGDTGGALQSRQLPQEGTKAPWAMATEQSSRAAHITTAAPWANSRPLPQQATGMPLTKQPWAVSSSSTSAGTELPTRFAPSQPYEVPPTRLPTEGPGNDGPTRAPWTKPQGNTGGSVR